MSEQTTFILGAGASVPYGYPTGRDMVQSILEGLRTPDRRLYRELAGHADQVQSVIADFRSLLRNADPPSVDAFVEKRSEFEYIARLCIAHELLACENESMFDDRGGSDGWYQELLERLHYLEGDAIPDRVQVVTFNYDRSLEVYLERAFRAIYPGQGQAEKMLERIPIHHVYGSIFKADETLRRRAYRTDSSSGLTEAAAAGIALMQDARQDMAVLKEAWNAIALAEKVCFLGFGFHESNTKALFLRFPLSGSQAIFSSSVGLDGAHQADAAGKVGSEIHFTPKNGNCLDTFRHFRLLR